MDIVTRPCLVLSYVCFVIRNINYCCSCSCYTATLYIELGPIFSMHASAAGVCACIGRRELPNDKDNSALRANWSRLAERCLKSYCSVVSLFFRHHDELFRKSAASLPRNVDVVVQRRTTSLGVLHRRGRCCSTRTIISTIPGVPWSFNGSGRVVSCEHGCWTRTRRHNSSSRYLSSYADEVRLCRPTPEARDSSLTSCWRPGYSRCRLLAADPLALPCLIIFPSLFRLTLTVLNWLYACSGHYHKTNYTNCHRVAPTCIKSYYYLIHCKFLFNNNF